MYYHIKFHIQHKIYVSAHQLDEYSVLSNNQITKDAVTSQVSSSGDNMDFVKFRIKQVLNNTASTLATLMLCKKNIV